MIVSRINSGLGNQMFQYALGRYLSLKNDTELGLDAYGFESNYAGRQYGLQVFNVQGKLLNSKEAALWRGESNFLQNIRFQIQKRFPFYHRRIIQREHSAAFESKILEIPSPAYLIGYWQSEQYFKEIESVIRQDFTFKQLPSIENMYWLNEIIAVPAVSLHIRRGDYATHAVIAQSHGTLPLSYYAIAIDYLAKHISNMHLFVFSDDVSWAKQHLITQFPTHFVAHNSMDFPHEDLRLMSHCQHHIIANSTFSWWAAWLNSSPNKLVIAPKQWFKDASKPTPNLIPSNWIQL